MAADIALIHGGCHGAWCWQPLIGELARHGRTGHALDLPGHGADTTPRDRVTRAAYLAAADAFLAALAAPRITLVGHSIAGMLLAELAARHAARVDCVVYLAAVVPAAGQTTMALIPEARRPAYAEMAARSADNTISVDFATARARFFNDMPLVRARHWYAMLTPQPLAPYLDPVPCGPQAIRARVRYIAGSADRTFTLEHCRHMASALGAPMEVLTGGHDMMLSRPTALAARLLA